MDGRQRAARLRRAEPQARWCTSPTRRWSGRCSSGSCGSARRRCWRRSCGRRACSTTKGRPIDKGYLYKCLNNRTYLGLAIHKGTAYPGEHAAIIDQDLWDKVHAILAENGRTRSANTRAQTPALLKGLIFGPTGAAMSPTHTRKGNRLYRYYVSQDVLKRGPDACPVGRVPAAEIEAAVIDQLRGVFRQPEISSACGGRREPSRTTSPRTKRGKRCRNSTRSGTSSSPRSRRGSCSCLSSGWMCMARASRSASA